MTDTCTRLTTLAGLPVGDYQTSRIAGPSGQVLTEAHHLNTQHNEDSNKEALQ